MNLKAMMEESKKREYKFDFKELQQIDNDSFSYDSIKQMVAEDYQESQSIQSRSLDTEEIEVQIRAQNKRA